MAALVLAGSGAAIAQTGNYAVKSNNFDLWCQEQQHLPPERCDKRLPDDDKAFTAWRSSIERYEIPYLQNKQNEVALDRNIITRDPVTSPGARNTQSQSLQEQRSPGVNTRTPTP